MSQRTLVHPSRCLRVVRELVLPQRTFSGTCRALVLHAFVQHLGCQHPRNIPSMACPLWQPPTGIQGSNHRRGWQMPPLAWLAVRFVLCCVAAHCRPYWLGMWTGRRLCLVLRVARSRPCMVGSLLHRVCCIWCVCVCDLQPFAPPHQALLCRRWWWLCARCTVSSTA